MCCLYQQLRRLLRHHFQSHLVTKWGYDVVTWYVSITCINITCASFQTVYLKETVQHLRWAIYGNKGHYQNMVRKQCFCMYLIPFMHTYFQNISYEFQHSTSYYEIHGTVYNYKCVVWDYSGTSLIWTPVIRAPLLSRQTKSYDDKNLKSKEWKIKMFIITQYNYITVFVYLK